MVVREIQNSVDRKVTYAIVYRDINFNLVQSFDVGPVWSIAQATLVAEIEGQAARGATLTRVARFAYSISWDGQTLSGFLCLESVE